MHVWRAWENTSANTGYYLGAMSYRYRCTRDPDVLAICRRTLAALKHIYDMGAEFDEPGFLTKPYGGVATTQTSGDQLQCVTVGLAAYRHIAGPEDTRTIDEMFTGFADYEIRQGYWPKAGRVLRAHDGVVGLDQGRLGARSDLRTRAVSRLARHR